MSVTSKLSGYLTTAQSTLAGTELNSLASSAVGSGSYSALGTEVDNTSNLYLYSDLSLILASWTATAGGYLNIYAVPTIDGTNYPTWVTGASGTTTAANENYRIATLFANSGTGAQTLNSNPESQIILPSGKFKFAVQNCSGANLASSANSLSWRPWALASG